MLRARGPRGVLARAGLGLLVALVLLALVEGLLRLLLGPPPPPLLVRSLWDFSKPLFEFRGQVVDPVYQRSDAIPPFGLHKQPDRPRVLVVGGSTVRAGSRLPLAQEFPMVLERLLLASGVRVEVINLGRPVFDSSGVREVVSQAMVLDPDVVVSVQGHNDIGNVSFLRLYGDLESALAARLWASLYRFRIYHLLERFTVPAPRLSLPSPRGDLTRFRAVDRSRVLLAETFYRQNLDHMTHEAQDRGVAVVLATIVGDDLASPGAPSCPDRIPPGSGKLTPREWKLGIPVPDLTLPNVEAALVEDPDCADLLYLKGLLLTPHDPLGAAALQRARDLDPLPIRATTAVQEATREVARDRGATLVDLDALARQEGAGVAPRAWFVDPVHFSALGHLEIARMLLDPLRQVLEGIDASEASPDGRGVSGR
ncbi:MAG: SGNH/GDSL hydrolase family protein [Deltaproteobacteria bacterium]|nr:SGNH/GDSL hydrolase family protein [Deltaproteobacteria bacterium]